MRSSTESMAALIGGVDSFSCLAFNTIDVADSLLEEKSNPRSDLGKLLALNTQLLHRHEAHLTRVSDPAAGSYYIEKLTDILARQAWANFQEIEKEGGIIKSLQSTKLQTKIKDQAKQKLEEVARGKITVLGSNAFPPLGPLTPPPHFEDMPTQGKTPSHQKVEPATKEKSFENITSLPAWRLSQNFEKLRLSTLRHIHRGGKVPQVLLLLFGEQAMAKARANFARNFFGCAGYQNRRSQSMQHRVKLRVYEISRRYTEKIFCKRG